MDPNRNDPPRNGPNKSGDDKNPKRNIWLPLILAVVAVIAIGTIYNAISESQYTQTTWSDFQQAVAADNLQEVQLKYDRIIYLTKEEAAKPAAQQKACYTGLPNGNIMGLADQLYAMGAAAAGSFAFGADKGSGNICRKFFAAACRASRHQPCMGQRSSQRLSGYSLFLGVVALSHFTFPPNRFMSIYRFNIPHCKVFYKHFIMRSYKKSPHIKLYCPSLYGQHKKTPLCRQY